MSVKKSLVIYCGGTIGMVKGSNGYVTQKDFFAKFVESIPELNDVGMQQKVKEKRLFCNVTSCVSSRCAEKLDTLHGITCQEQVCVDDGLYNHANERSQEYKKCKLNKLKDIDQLFSDSTIDKNKYNCKIADHIGCKNAPQDMVINEYCDVSNDYLQHINSENSHVVYSNIENEMDQMVEEDSFDLYTNNDDQHIDTNNDEQYNEIATKEKDTFRYLWNNKYHEEIYNQNNREYKQNDKFAKNCTFNISNVKSSTGDVNQNSMATKKIEMQQEDIEFVNKNKISNTFITPTGIFYDIIELDVIIDSSNANLENYFEILKMIKLYYEQYSGFVIVHGTDTMTYASSYISSMTKNLLKPIVFTGSISPMTVKLSEGVNNLSKSLKYANKLKGGVYVQFGHLLCDGSKITKVSVDNENAFIGCAGYSFYKSRFGDLYKILDKSKNYKENKNQNFEANKNQNFKVNNYANEVNKHTYEVNKYTNEDNNKVVNNEINTNKDNKNRCEDKNQNTNFVKNEGKLNIEQINDPNGFNINKKEYKNSIDNVDYSYEDDKVSFKNKKSIDINFYAQQKPFISAMENKKHKNLENKTKEILVLDKLKNNRRRQKEKINTNEIKNDITIEKEDSILTIDNKVNAELNNSKSNEFVDDFIEETVFFNRFETKIAIVKIYPNIQKDYFEFLVKTHKAIILETYGTGNGLGNCHEILEILEKYIKDGNFVINVSQCLNGFVNNDYEANDGLSRIGVIGGRNITSEALFCHLASILGNFEAINAKDEIINLINNW
ncbi:hypothetical protein COBT_000233 [Conglomerata obtusa]